MSPPEQPTFRATIERVVIDAAVVDQEGRPITDVTAAEFDLKIDGKPRGLLSVEFLPHLAEPAAPAPRDRIRLVQQQRARRRDGSC